MTGRALAVLLLLNAGVAGGGGAHDDPMPISVKAKAHFVTPGSPVTFTGTTVADGKRFDVRLTIVKPNAQPAVVATKVDAQGNYTQVATFAPAAASEVHSVGAGCSGAGDAARGFGITVQVVFTKGAATNFTYTLEGK